jgi:hypothetical protein
LRNSDRYATGVSARIVHRGADKYQEILTLKFNHAGSLGKMASGGADLWHLSAAKSLQSQLPEMLLPTFNNRLRKVAQGEGLIDI